MKILPLSGLGDSWPWFVCLFRSWVSWYKHTFTCWTVWALPSTLLEIGGVCCFWITQRAGLSWLSPFFSSCSLSLRENFQVFLSDSSFHSFEFLSTLLCPYSVFVPEVLEILIGRFFWLDTSVQRGLCSYIAIFKVQLLPWESNWNYNRHHENKDWTKMAAGESPWCSAKWQKKLIIDV